MVEWGGLIGIIFIVVFMEIEDVNDFFFFEG